MFLYLYIYIYIYIHIYIYKLTCYFKSHAVCWVMLQFNKRKAFSTLLSIQRLVKSASEKLSAL